MNSPWIIELFGQLSARQAGRQITRFRTQKTGLLLAYLALNPDRIHPRDEIIERFWPDEEIEAGRNSLRVALSSLRRQLEPPGIPPGAVLFADRSRVGLNPIAFQTDVKEFQTTLVAAERAEAPSEQEVLLRKGVDLYRGPLLPGAYEDWVTSERDRLSEAYLGALRQLVRLLAQTRDFEGAIRYARLALAADPLREEFHRSLMRLYLALGRPGEALSQYDELERLLRAEMDTSPSAAAQELASQIPGFGVARPEPRPASPAAEIGQQPLVPASAEVSAAEIDAVVSPPSDTHRLPIQFTRFFGREEEMEQLLDLLTGVQLFRISGTSDSGADGEESEPRMQPAGLEARPLPGARAQAAQGARAQEVLKTRLVTLTGAGGSGKTRLSIEAAARLQEGLNDRVWFVPLAEVSDPRRIIDAILNALRLPPSRTGDSLDQVVAALLGPPALLILDNFEHLASGGAPVVLALLKRLPSLTCLVSSRRRLHLPGEIELPVGPLPVPEEGVGGRGVGVGEEPPSSFDPQRLAPNANSLTSRRPGEGGASPTPGPRPPTPNALLSIPSVALFVERAQAARPDFQITPRNAEDIAALCRKLEGIPLALELAAARAQVLSPAQMLARLTERFELLATRRMDKSSRHRSVWAAIDWSYHLLSPDLQRFFARLAVFRGGWSVESAEQVCDTPSALDFLAQLRGHSLILMEEEEAEPRFRMLETLREYAIRQLEEPEALARRHADYFLEFAERVEPGYFDRRERVTLDLVESEHENLLKALEWLREGQDCHEAGMRLAGALRYFWIKRGYFREGRGELEQTLDVSVGVATSPRIKAMVGLATLLFFQGEMAPANALSEQALNLCREIGDPWLLAVCCDLRGSILTNEKENDRAKPLLEEALERFRRLNDRWGTAVVLDSLGNLALHYDDFETGKRLLEESAALFREVGERWSGAWPLRALGEIAMVEQTYDSARAYFHESLLMSIQLGDKEGIAVSRRSLGQTALKRDEKAEAKAQFEESLILFRELGKTSSVAVTTRDLGRLAVDEDQWELAGYRYLECMVLLKDLGRTIRAAELLEELSHLCAEKDRFLGAARLWGAAQSLREAPEKDVAARSETSEPARQTAKPLAAIREGLVRHSSGDRRQADRLLADTLAEGRTLAPEEAIRAAFQG